MKKITKILIIFLSFFLLISNVQADEIEVASKNVILYNMTDDMILYEKLPDEQVNIASLTKIMTTIVAIENIQDYDAKVTVTKEMLEKVTRDLSTAGFKVGDTLSYNDLLYGTIIKSGADATEILAYSISGSEENFAVLMNEKAKEIGMTNSSFSNVIGIEGENHYSTARDLLLLVKYSLKNQKFREIFSTQIYKLDEETEFKGPLYKMNNDEELNMKYVKGTKTGYTSKAGLCLATYAKNNNTEYILVTIGASYENKMQHMLDTKNIYEYYFNNYDYLDIFKKGDTLIKIKSKFGKEYTIKNNENIKLYLNKSIKKKDLVYEYKGKSEVDTKVKKGDKIGKIIVKNNDEILSEKDVIMNENVNFELIPFIKEYPEVAILFGLTIIIFILVIRIIRIKKK